MFANVVGTNNFNVSPTNYVRFNVVCSDKSDEVGGFNANVVDTEGQEAASRTDIPNFETDPYEKVRTKGRNE